MAQDGSLHFSPMIDNIQSLTRKNQETGECLSGKYFWGSAMILVDECSRKRIEEVVEYLIGTGEFNSMFSFCEEIDLDK